MSIKSPIVYKVLDFFLKKIELFLRKKHNAGGELSVYSELYILTKRADLLLKALEITGTPDLRIEIAKLQEKCKNQAKELTHLNNTLRCKNIALDAYHHVWCNGGCYSGVHRYDKLGPDTVTQEIVDTAIRNTDRLKTWFANWQYKTKDKKV